MAWENFGFFLRLLPKAAISRRCRHCPLLSGTINNAYNPTLGTCQGGRNIFFSLSQCNWGRKGPVLRSFSEAGWEGKGPYGALEFVIAKGMTWQDSTAETRGWQERMDLQSFKTKSTWRKLTTLVRVRADADIFPLRASHGEGDQTTIGVNYASSDTGLWFTLADCAASKVLCGKAIILPMTPIICHNPSNGKHN